MPVFFNYTGQFSKLTVPLVTVKTKANPHVHESGLFLIVYGPSSSLVSDFGTSRPTNIL